MFTPSSPAVVEPAAGAADARADGPPVDAAAAERLGLLPLLREASADDEATLKRAVERLDPNPIPSRNPNPNPSPNPKPEA